jgi:hypothetical protein
MSKPFFLLGYAIMAVAQCCHVAAAQERDDKNQPAVLWKDMDSPEGLKALAAIKSLAARPKEVLPLVREQLRTQRPIEQANVTRWIADLDDERFAVRERATTELKKLGERAEHGLQKALASDPSAEVRQRVENLLRQLEPPSASPGRLRALRIVFLLEEMATPAAEKLLGELAKGPLEDQRTLDARSALERLARGRTTPKKTPEPEPTLQEMDILVDDVSKYIKDANVPMRKGAGRFRVRKLEPIGAVTQITARDALTYNGFAMEYVLKAKADPEKLKGKALNSRELRDVEITYSDDLLKAKDLSERDLEKLVQLLLEPENLVQWHGTVIPGGEMLSFSDPMRKLIILGEKARHRMEQCLADPRIENEAALVLGAIGNEHSITLLIDAYPDSAVRAKGRDHDDAPTAKAVYFTSALTYLTAKSIGRSRYGADCKPENRRLWKEWWNEERGSFRVPKQKPNATWVPHYPNLSKDWARQARDHFAGVHKE